METAAAMLAPKSQLWYGAMMLRKTLILLAAGLVCTSAAAKPPAKPAAHPAAKTAKAAPAAPATPIDARDPASLIGLLSAVGAQGQVAHKDGDAVFVTVTSPSANFSAQFAGCNAQGRGCQAVLFDQPGGLGAPTVAQINAFNQTSVMCRVYQDKNGKPHVEYSTLLFPSSSRQEMLMHLNAWRGCLGDFTDFLKDPNGYLAGAA